MKLDPIDLHILAELEQNGRITNSLLARTIGLSASPCLARVARLEREGYISGYSAQVNLSAIGEIVTVFTEITLQDRKVATISRFEQKLRSVPELCECSRVSGDCDYILKFVTRSVGHYRDTIMKFVEDCPFVDLYFSYFVVRTIEVGSRYFMDQVHTER